MVNIILKLFTCLQDELNKQTLYTSYGWFIPTDGFQPTHTTRSAYDIMDSFTPGIIFIL